MTDGAHGERAAEDEDMLHCRQTSGGTGASGDTRRGRPPLPLSLFLHFLQKKKQKTTARHVRKTSGQRRKFSICKISSVFTLSCCQLVFCRRNDSDSSFNQTYRFG